jgi:hypothetical protein
LNSSAFSDDINWAFDLLAGVQGPGTSKPLVLGLWRDLFPDTVALYFKSRLWVLLLMLGDGVGHHLPILPRSVDFVDLGASCLWLLDGRSYLLYAEPCIARPVILF